MSNNYNTMLRSPSKTIIRLNGRVIALQDQLFVAERRIAALEKTKDMVDAETQTGPHLDAKKETDE